MKTVLRRYDDSTRMNHWLIAILFVLAGLSGLAFFHPSLFFLSGLFGGGSWTRVLHPYFGVAMFLAFLVIFFRLARHNLIGARDREWLAKSGEMMAGRKEQLPPVGRYNGGQKLVFWVMALSLFTLLVTGIIFWRAWVGSTFPITVIRAATLLHAIAATLLILGTIVHIYAAIWVQGTVRAMTRGTVTDGWARLNHPLWHQEMTTRK